MDILSFSILTTGSTLMGFITGRFWDEITKRFKFIITKSMREKIENIFSDLKNEVITERQAQQLVINLLVNKDNDILN